MAPLTGASHGSACRHYFRSFSLAFLAASVPG